MCVFCVNVLNQEQHFVSDVFAGRYKEIQDRFECGEWDDGVLGCPRLIEATTSLECEIFNHQKVGSHYVIFGEVAEINFGKNAQSLVYADRSYQVAQPLND